MNTKDFFPVFLEYFVTIFTSKPNVAQCGKAPYHHCHHHKRWTENTSGLKMKMYQLESDQTRQAKIFLI